jgi:hypothetical protein
LGSTLVTELCPGRRPVEGPPAIPLKVAIPGAGSNVPAHTVSTGSITDLVIEDLRLERCDTRSRVRGRTRMPDSRLVLSERRPVDLTLERIGEERVRNVLWAVWGSDAKVGETSGVVDLTRR